MAGLADHLNLRQKGQANSRDGQDSVTLHVNPREAQRVVPILLAMGGSGRHDPETDGWHFDVGDNDDSSGNSYGDGGTSSGGVGSATDEGGGRSDSAFGPGGELSGFGDWAGGLANSMGFSIGPDNSWSYGGPGSSGGGGGNNDAYENALAEQANYNQSARDAYDSYMSAKNDTVDEAYNEVTGDLGTSGRGGNVGGLEGPSGGLGVGGFGSRGAADEAISSYANDPGAWNAANNNFAGLDGPVDADTFANWASRSGLMSQVGAGQKGTVDDISQFVSEHPGLMNALGLGLSIANPLAGAIYGSVYGLSQGRGGGLGSMLGGLSGVPGGSAIGGALGNLATGNWQSALSGALGYGLGSTGNSLGQYGYSLAGPVGGYVGNQAQGYGIGALTSALSNADFSGNTATAGTDNAGNGSDGVAGGGYSSDGGGAYAGGSQSGGSPVGGISLASILSGMGANAQGGYLPTSFQQTTAEQVPINMPSSGTAVPLSIASRKSDYGQPLRLSELLRQEIQSAS